MKKILILTIVATFGLTACEKDYSCVCTLSGTTTGKETQTITDTKKNAKELCDEGDYSSNGQSRQCEIDD